MNIAQQRIEDSLDDQADDEYLTAAAVRRYFGGVSDMTLFRWAKSRGFPKPDLTVGGLRYWRRRTIKNWKPAA